MRAFQPVFRPLGLRPAPALPALHRLPLAAAATSQTTPFSTSAALQAKKRGPKKDARISERARFFPLRQLPQQGASARERIAC